VLGRAGSRRRALIAFLVYASTSLRGGLGRQLYGIARRRWAPRGRIFEVLDETPRSAARQGQKRCGRSGTNAFEHVAFAYASRRTSRQFARAGDEGPLRGTNEIKSGAGQMARAFEVGALQPGLTVLEDINLDIAPGEPCAGRARAGPARARLFNLIPRFYDPTQGVVCVDGQTCAR